MKWIKIGDRYRVDMEKVRCYGISSNDLSSIEVDYDEGGHDTFACDSKEKASNILKEIDTAMGLYSIQED